MYIICYLTITKSMYLEYFLQEVFANVCKRLQTFLIRIQDSRFPEKLLESKGIGFKIQDSQKNFLNPRIQDSRFKISSENICSLPVYHVHAFDAPVEPTSCQMNSIGAGNIEG